MAFWLYAATAALTLFVFLVAADIMGLFSNKNHFQVDGKTVVITGGTQGMGRGVAKLLASKGANVVIVARTESNLIAAAKYITAAAKDPSRQRFHYIAADLTKEEESKRVIAEATVWNNNQTPDIVWSIAGASFPKFFVDTTMETMRYMMDLNYWAPTYLAHASMKAWLDPQKPKTANPRHFIMTSSAACFVGVAGYAGYAPTKAALRSLADNLRSEVNLYRGALKSDHPGPAADIKIHCIVPGGIDSPGFVTEQKEKPEITKILEKDDPHQSEDEVARKAVQGLERGGYLITTHWFGYIMKGSMFGGSPRDNWFLDTVTGWVTGIAWLFIGPDMERTVYKFGQKNGAVAQKA